MYGNFCYRKNTRRQMKKFAGAFIYATIEIWEGLNFAQRFVITLIFFILGMLLVDYYVHGEPTFEI